MAAAAASVSATDVNMEAMVVEAQLMARLNGKQAKAALELKRLLAPPRPADRGNCLRPHGPQRVPSAVARRRAHATPATAAWLLIWCEHERRDCSAHESAGACGAEWWPVAAASVN